MRLAMLLIAASCYRGGDGPQDPSNEPETDYPGKRCDKCYPTAIGFGVVTTLWTSLTIAANPLKPGWDRRWLWAGIGLGATTIAIGVSHAALNRDELEGSVLVPGVVGVATGVPAIVTGVIGLVTEHNAPVTPVPMIVPGGGGVSISGRF